jgi:hypothetical protein
MSMARGSFVLVAVVAAVAGGCGLLSGLDDFRRVPGSRPGAGASGGAGVCEPGEVEACYSGPEGTEGVGLCRAGQRPCNADGSGFGNCEGEVTPAVEDCAALGDEDCNGVACSDPMWANLFGDATDQLARAVGIDAKGNVVVVGYFQGSVNFGGETLVSAGAEDIFVAKFDPAGRHLWSNRFGDAHSQLASAIGIDKQDNVVVAGSFIGTMNFGGPDLISEGADGFVVKLDSLGEHVWSKRFGGAGWDSVDAIAVDSGGDIFIGGSFDDSIDLGLGPMTTVGSQQDIFLAKLTGDEGAGVWSERFGDISIEELDALTLDTSNSVYVAGFFRGNVSFGGEIFTAAYQDGFLAKLDSYGNHVWSKAIGAENGVIVDVAVDLSGDVIAVGSFSGTINLGGGDLLSASPPFDAFVVKYTTTGAHSWSRALDIGLRRIVTDADRNMIFSGIAMSTIDWGGGPLDGDEQDMTLAKLGPAGDHIWSKRFASDAGNLPLGLAVDRSTSSVVLTGSQAGSVDYGLGPVVSAGAQDVFVAKFAP